MQMTEIGREKLGTKSAEPMMEVINEAREVLGYGVTEAPEGNLSCLREILRELEIEPLVEADVVRYQAERIAELMLDSTFLQSVMRGSVDYRFNSYWQSVALKNYREPIPEFVLAKAIQIKKRMPGAELFIQSLEGDPDPFLLVNDGFRDHAYIEVWAEPKFEGRISARG